MTCLGTGETWIRKSSSDGLPSRSRSDFSSGLSADGKRAKSFVGMFATVSKISLDHRRGRLELSMPHPRERLSTHLQHEFDLVYAEVRPRVRRAGSTHAAQSPQLPPYGGPRRPLAG
jgi:hypothetical protein